MKKNSYMTGVLLAFFGGVAWGISGACGEYLFKYKEINSQWLVSVRLLVAGFSLFTALLFYKKRKIFAIFQDKKSILLLLFYGIFGLMFCQYTYFVAIKLSNAAIATVLQYTAPAFIIILVSLKAKKIPQKIEILALFLAMLGVVFLATHGKFSLSLPTNALVFGLISALCIVIYSIAPIPLNKAYGTATTLSLGLIIGGIVASLFTENLWNFEAINDTQSRFALFGVIFFGTIIAFSFYMLGLNLIGPSRASLIASVEPISAAIFSHIFLGTQFVFMDYLGFFLILSCTFLLSRKSKNTID